jgi:alpha-1,2-rhamnosyltransferase
MLGDRMCDQIPAALGLESYPNPNPAAYSHRRIYLECTHTFRYGGNTGIQRVVRNVITHCRDVGQELGIHCEPVVCTGRHFYAVNGIGDKRPKAVAAGTYLHNVFTAGKNLLRALIPVSDLNQFSLVRAGRRVANNAVHSIGSSMAGFTSTSKREVIFSRGDIVLFLDATWHYSGLAESIAAARDQGAYAGFLLYDIMPIRFPSCSDKTVVHAFRSWIDLMTREADFFVAISENARHDLVAFCQENAARDSRILKANGSFRLGSELDGAGRGPLKPRVELQALFDPDEPGVRNYITVGTIEPRKNHLNILDAFESVWEQGGGDRLIVVGARGWLSDFIVNRIETHREFGRRLTMFNDLDDEELRFVYRHADALIVSSLGEGFCLPIVEALAHGLPVFASDIDIHRDTGGQQCHYFRLDSPASLACLVLNYDGAKPTADYCWPDWRDSTRELIQNIVEIVGQIAVSDSYADPPLLLECVGGQH